MSDENNKEAIDAGVDAVDAAEIGVTGEIPVAGSIYHGARALTALGEAGIDYLYGDEKNEEEHLKKAGIEGVETIPGAALGAKFIGEKKMRARLYGEKYVEPATPESIKADEAAGLERTREYERAHPEDIQHGPIHHRDPDDTKAVYELQKYRYQMEMADQAANGKFGPDGYLKQVHYPDLSKAEAEADTTAGWAEAKAYQVASPLLSMIGIHAPDPGDPDSQDLGYRYGR